MSRLTNTKGQVTGVYLGDSKIGGPIDDHILLFPDPMGATGSSMAEVITHYKEKVVGKPKKIITLNLIITPQYLRTLHEQHSDVIVYAVRLDRGGSSKEVLQCMPGERWQEESGLDERQYIIPGAGGLGEVINNAYC